MIALFAGVCNIVQKASISACLLLAYNRVGVESV